MNPAQSFGRKPWHEGNWTDLESPRKNLMRTITTAVMLALVLASTGVRGTQSMVRWSKTGQHADSRPQSPLAQNRGDMVTIDGSKNPELLPEWLVWQMSFRTLALIEHEDAPAFKQDLILSDADKRLLYREASQQRERDRQCFASLDQRHKELAAAGVEPDAMQKDLQGREVQCRWQVLEARDRVLEALGPEARASLLNWVAQERAAIRTTVSAAGLAHFRRPQ